MSKFLETDSQSEQLSNYGMLKQGTPLDLVLLSFYISALANLLVQHRGKLSFFFSFFNLIGYICCDPPSPPHPFMILGVILCCLLLWLHGASLIHYDIIMVALGPLLLFKEIHFSFFLYYQNQLMALSRNNFHNLNTCSVTQILVVKSKENMSS